jgi:hypothetical protein
MNRRISVPLKGIQNPFQKTIKSHLKSFSQTTQPTDTMTHDPGKKAPEQEPQLPQADMPANSTPAEAVDLSDLMAHATCDFFDRLFPEEMDIDEA